MRYLVLLLILTGCAPEVVTSDPGAVSVLLNGNGVDDATSIATAQCAKYGKVARFIGQSGPPGYTAHFQCVSP